MPEQWLADYYDRYKGQPGVLFGKGPSLDSWDLPKLPGEIWMTINEACRALPDADFHIMNDFAVYENLQHVRWKPKNGLILTRGTVCRQKLVGGTWPENTLYYTRDMDRIYKSTATGGGAVQALAAMGITDLLMVGFDAYDHPDGPEYGKCFGSLPYWVGHGDPTKRRWHKVNCHITEVAERCGTTMRFWHRDMDGIREGRLSLRTPESAS